MIHRFISGSTNVLPTPPMAFVIEEAGSAFEDELQPFAMSVPKKAMVLRIIFEW